MFKVFPHHSLSLALLASVALSACKDTDNRVISKQTSPRGQEFYLMPILERGVTDITVAAAWTTDWISKQGGNEWVPGLATDMMLSGGTDTLSPAEVLELFEDKNTYGNIGAYTDTIYAEVEFPNTHMDAVLPVLASLFQSPRVDQKWFDRIKGQRLEAATSKARPLSYQMWDAARVALFGMVPLTDFMNGQDIADLKAVTREDLFAWYETSFDTRPRALVVTGATDAAQAGEIVDSLLPDVISPDQAFVLKEDMRIPAQPIYLHVPEAEKSTLGFLGPMPSDADGKAVLDIAVAHLFASGAGSPLFETVRSELGASYGMGAQLFNFSRDMRFFSISGEIEGAKMETVASAVLDTYAAFRADPDTTQLGQIKTHIASNLGNEQKYVSSSAEMIRELILQNRDVQSYHSFVENTEAITAEDVADRLATAFPPADQLGIFAAGPDPSVLPGACVITSAEEAASCATQD